MSLQDLESRYDPDISNIHSSYNNLVKGIER